MQPELSYVETIQTEHVLTAMQRMGWQPGTKLPGYSAIQTTLRRLYGNGGDGNRMRELREAAIRLATGQPVGHDDQEQADLPPLPEEIQQELQSMATIFEQQLTRLDKRLAQRLDSVQSEINTDARTKIDAIKRESVERLSAANDELDQALTDLQAASTTISALQAELATMRETSARAAGRLEVLEQELNTRGSRINSLEAELATSHAEIATSSGRTEALESDLRVRIEQIETLDASLAEAREAATTAISRAQSLENELTNRAEEVQCLQVELASNKEAAAKNSGRLEVLEQEQAAKTVRIADLEAKLTETTTAMANATGRAEVLEQELATARAHTRKGAKP